MRRLRKIPPDPTRGGCGLRWPSLLFSLAYREYRPSASARLAGLNIRRQRLFGSRVLRLRLRARHASEAAVAAPELAQRGIERRLVEVGPERVDEHELRVGAFPEQEIAEAALAAGPNQQVDGDFDVGIHGRRELALEVLRREGARCGLRDRSARGV